MTSTINSKIYRVAEGSRVFSFLTYNVDQAVREEQHEETRWGNRRDRVHDLIVQSGCDVVLLQELRSLPGCEKPCAFLDRFRAAGYAYRYQSRNPQAMSFGLAVLWKEDRFYAADSIVRWFSDTPTSPSDFSNDGFGSNVLCVKLFAVENERVLCDATGDPKCLWVLNTHFLLDEASKERSAANLGQMIAHDAAFAGSAIVLAGDFNFFPDLDGPKQRSLLLEASGMRDLGASGALLSTNGQRVDGTFVGYGHDNMKAPDGQVGSRLDHIFVKKIESESDLVLIDKTMRDIEPPTLSTRDYPSDHFPIKVAFAL